MKQAQYQVVCGDSARMDMIRDQEADLVFTSPPYYPPSIQERLEQPQSKQLDFSEVRSIIANHARTLEPVFREIARILRPGRAAILQTKDMRYGGALIGLSGLHREIMEGEGFRLIHQILWEKRLARHDPIQKFMRDPTVGTFRLPPTEIFLVFALDGFLEKRGGATELDPHELEDCCHPVWRLSPARDQQAHRHASPPNAVRRLIALYTMPGDLVVDPFLGHGTTVKLAFEMNRRAIGYDIERECVAATDRWILGQRRSK
jgi:DNA modification methylase